MIRARRVTLSLIALVALPGGISQEGQRGSGPLPREDMRASPSASQKQASQVEGECHASLN